MESKRGNHLHIITNNFKNRIVACVLVLLSFLISGLLTIFIISSIGMAFVSTHRLVEAGITSADYQNDDNSIKFENSVWAKCPGWGMYIIILITCLISFPAFILFFMRLFRPLFSPEK
jgi:hypothetical protein